MESEAQDIPPIDLQASPLQQLSEDLSCVQTQLQTSILAQTWLLKIGSLFLRNNDSNSILSEILNAVMEVTQADFGNIQLLDPASKHLKIVVQRGFPDWWLHYWSAVPHGHGACGSALQRSERVVCEDIVCNPLFKNSEACEVQLKAGVRAVQSTPIVGRNGEPLGIISTHYKQPRKFSETILSWVDLFACQVANILERIHIEEKLQEVNRRKDAFLAVLGHELRNPLSAIRSAAHLLQHKETRDSALEMAIGVVDRQSTHMVRIIDDLMDVSRIANGKIYLQPSYLNIRELVEKGIATRKLTGLPAQVTLTLTGIKEDLWILGDEVRLTQVFDNLLSNALKFTPAPGTITVHLKRESDCAVVEVHDTGIGIRRENLYSIFNSFHQEINILVRTGGGLGLGLALAKGLVELHQGALTARSPGPGLGSTFTVCLPLHRHGVKPT